MQLSFQEASHQIKIVGKKKSRKTFKDSQLRGWVQLLRFSSLVVNLASHPYVCLLVGKLPTGN